MTTWSWPAGPATKDVIGSLGFGKHDVRRNVEDLDDISLHNFVTMYVNSDVVERLLLHMAFNWNQTIKESADFEPEKKLYYLARAACIHLIEPLDHVSMKPLNPDTNNRAIVRMALYRALTEMS